MDPTALVSAFWKQNPFFSGYTQQDVAEMIRNILETIDDDQKKDCGIESLIPSDLISKYEKIKNDNVIEDVESILLNRGGDRDKLLKERVPKYTSSVVTDLFQGNLLSEITCKTCGNISQTIDSFYELAISIPSKCDGKKVGMLGWGMGKCFDVLNSLVEYATAGLVTFASPVELKDCLSHFFRTEDLFDEYKCSKCKTYVRATKRLSLFQNPKIFILHVKRFHYSSFFSKSNVYIIFDFELSIEGIKYELKSVIQHHGTYHGGHYTCYVKYGTSWYFCDDQSVSKASRSDVLAAQAYVLVYQRKDTDSPDELTTDELV